MTHELNMIDYVLEQISKEYKELDKKHIADKKIKIYLKALMDINDKALLLNSPPKLGDFVPTNEEGEVMEKPKTRCLDYSPNITTDEYCLIVDEYQNALDRRLWSGWEVDKEYPTQVTDGKQLLSQHDDCWDKTYENLITSGIKLERIERK